MQEVEVCPSCCRQVYRSCQRCMCSAVTLTEREADRLRSRRMGGLVLIVGGKAFWIVVWATLIYWNMVLQDGPSREVIDRSHRFQDLMPYLLLSIVVGLVVSQIGHWLRKSARQRILASRDSSGHPPP